MKICEDGKYKIYVYHKDHNPPHCHVRTNGRDIVVYLPSLERLDDKALKRDLKELLLENLDLLIDKWEEFNG
jgi:hypothetical protein